MSGISYEIFFLPVGTSKSGDAIIVRYGDRDSGKYKIMIVDGGTKESGKKIVKHVNDIFNTSTVDYVVNTHPDQDHASGLTEVLENLEVKELWIHRPWKYSEEIIKFIKNSEEYEIDGRVTIKSFEERLSGEYYKYAKQLECLAIEKGILIKEPYEGASIGEFKVLSPNKDWHLYDLIVKSNKTKEIKQSDMKSYLESITESIYAIFENFLIETLKDNGVTSSENESSVILYANFDNNGILLTGDAGNQALNKAYDYAYSKDIDIKENLSFIQIPHHGSRRNVGPSILNKIIGQKQKNDEKKLVAYVSVGEDDKNHPRRVVTNAFYRRGCVVYETKGSSLRHSYKMGSIDGWNKAKNIELYNKVEKYD